MYEYDVIFIGSGHSCNHAATVLALAGKKVAFVEMDRIGRSISSASARASSPWSSPRWR